MTTERDLPALERVEALVRPHLNFDNETETYRHIASIGRISCTHGMGIDAVVRLATRGEFVGGDAALMGEFYTTPNRKFRNWGDTDLGSYIGEVANERGVDAILLGILYAGTYEPITEESELLNRINNGVVVAFNSTAIHENSQVDENTLNDLEHAVELILPEAPAIDAIEGIYPVDIESELELKKVLSELR